MPITKPRLMSGLPDDEALNSLIALHPDLLANRADHRLAIVEYYVPEAIDRTDGDDTAKVRIVHWEDVTADDHSTVERIRDARYRVRDGGKKGTPLDGIDDSVADDTGAEETHDKKASK